MKSRVQCCTSGKPTEDTHDAENRGYVPSALTALQATLCMRLHDKTYPFNHATIQDWYTYCMHVAFKLFNIRYNDISILISFLPEQTKALRDVLVCTKDKFCLPQPHTVFLFDSYTFSLNAFRIHRSSVYTRSRHAVFL